MKKSNTVKAKNHKKRVLVIGDIHAPFTLKGYLEHCKNTYKKYKCNEVVFIGDIIDNHYSSYHESDPNGLGGGEELSLAIKDIQDWYEAFPKATVIWGNHDRIIMRKAFSGNVPREWVKEYNEVLGTPKWVWKTEHVIDDVLYIHGEGGTARTKAKNDLTSVVQGHLHTQAYVEHFVGREYSIFAMQTGCGIDHNSYAMAYAKSGKKPAIACGVVLEGETAINVLMSL